MEDIITIYTTNDSIEAELIRSRLESFDVPCFIKSDNAGGVMPYLDVLTGFSIMVNKEDKKKAMDVLRGPSGDIA